MKNQIHKFQVQIVETDIKSNLTFIQQITEPLSQPSLWEALEAQPEQNHQGPCSLPACTAVGKGIL